LSSVSNNGFGDMCSSSSSSSNNSSSNDNSSYKSLLGSMGHMLPVNMYSMMLVYSNSRATAAATAVVGLTMT
jgi:hypothetical protein